LSMRASSWARTTTRRARSVKRSNMGGTPSIRISLSLMPEGQAREVSFTLEKTTRYASYNQD
jgi:hypothetical protein